MSWLAKGLFYWALMQLLFVPPIFVIALIALDLVRFCGRRRVAV
jgi:hypothetical protein